MREIRFRGKRMNENLFDKPLIMLATHCPETDAILIEKGKG
jgi:hypothetical protein